MLPNVALLSLLSLLTAFSLSNGQTNPEDLFSIREFASTGNSLGLSATLVCYADSVVSGFNIEYQIVKNGEPSYLTNQLGATSGRVSRRIENRRLKVTFNQLFAEDEGNYTCTASISEDSLSGIFTHTRQATLTVDKTKLEFLIAAVETYITVPNGDIAVSVCSTNQEMVASGLYGPVTVSWVRNGEPLDITGSSAYSYLNGVFTVKDYSVFDVSSTNFTCIVQWSSTFTEKPVEATRSFSISMDAAPKLLSRPGYINFYNFTVDGTTQYAIDCKLNLPYKQLEPFTTYTWYYPANTQQVVSRSVSTNSPYVDSSNRLVVTDAHPNHSGLYRCTGSNVFGSNSSYSNVTIVYPAPVIWVQFYMIIIYVVVVLAIIILMIALIVRFCCLGFCYVKDKKVVVDSTFYTTSKFDEVEEKKLLQDKTEFQEVEVDMQLAGVQVEESDDEDYVVPSDDDYKPKKKLMGYEGIDIEAQYPWDDEEEASRLHRTDPKQLVVAVKQKERTRRRKAKETRVEVHPKVQPEEPKIEVQPEPEPVPETPESQRKIDITQEVEVSPYDVDLTETQQRVVAQAKVVTKKVVTKTVEVVEDTEPLIEEDRMSGESQVFEATFGMSDLESEEPPDSDF